MWVHEAFADYAESIYTECQFGKAAGEDYVVGLRRRIANDRPIVGPYGVNREGSTDMYYKGANMLGTIRHIMANDSLFKALLRGLNTQYRHSIVTGAEVENFINSFSGRDFTKLFQQYLRTTEVPELQWTVKGGKLFTRFTKCVAGLSMLVAITVNGEERRVNITDQWSSPASGLRPHSTTLSVDRNWYITTERVGAAALKGSTGR
jgi:aminopeptidase N